MYDMVKTGAPLIGMVSFKDDDEGASEAASTNIPNWRPDPAFQEQLKKSTGKRQAAEA